MERLSEADRRLLGSYAELLSYPRVAGAGTAGQVDAAAPLRRLPLAEMQELYTSTFDLQPSCAPYVGYQILGEDSPARGPFLAKLAEIYAAEGFAPREELADHLAEVLRFLSVARSGAARDDLVTDGVLPALRRMLESFPEGGGNPYREVIVAVHALLADPAGIAGASAQREVRS